MIESAAFLLWIAFRLFFDDRNERKESNIIGNKKCWV